MRWLMMKAGGVVGKVVGKEGSYNRERRSHPGPQSRRFFNLSLVA